MSKPRITELLSKRLLYFDGAMGTMVQKHGLKAGENPEVFSLTHPEVISAIHRGYREAGADIITANTFGANAHKLAASGYTPAEIISASVSLAKQAAGPDGYAALDIGPIGELLEPMGSLSFEEAYSMFREEVLAGAEAGADLILIETMSDLYEIKAAILAAKENSDLPVFVTLTGEENGRTYTGCDMEAFAVLAESLGADAIGLNCSLGPVQMLSHLKRLISLTSLPVIFQPNAGLPRVENGVTSYDITPEQFGTCQKEAVEAGVAVAGGCCGTTPDYIAQVVANTKGMPAVGHPYSGPDRLCVPTAVTALTDGTAIGNDGAPCEELRETFADYDTSELINLALDAMDEGAQIINIDVSVPGIDQTRMMKTAVKELQEICRLPFMLTADSPEVLEAGLRYLNGRGLVRIPKERALQKIAQKYGAVIWLRK